MAENNSGKKYNYGVALLKIFMSYEVILCHFWDTGGGVLELLRPFAYLKSYAVPSLLILSFILTGEVFIERNKYKGKERLKRLIIPQIAWTISYWGYHVCMNLFRGNKDFLLPRFFSQLFTGAGLNSPMWYQVDIIIMTIVCIAFFCKDRQSGICMSWVLLLVSFYFQYSGINYMFFSETRSEIRYTFGRIFEIVPCVMLGLFIVYYRIFDKLEKCGGKLLLLFLCIGIFILYFPVFGEIEGFSYSGVSKMCLGGLIVCIFYLLPRYVSFNPQSIWYKMIQCISKYSMGVYCIHIMIGQICYYIFARVGLATSTFLGCIFIYFTCLAVCLVISKLPGVMGIIGKKMVQ